MNFAIDMHNFSIHDANENISRSFPEIFSQTYEHRNLSRISYPEHIKPKILSSLSEEKNQHLPELIKHEILPTEIKYITLTMCFTGITMNISKHVFRIDGAWLTSAPSKTGPWTVFTGISISLTAHNSSKITTPNTRHICSGPGILQVLITQSFGKLAGQTTLGILFHEFVLCKARRQMPLMSKIIKYMRKKANKRKYLRTMCM